MRIEPAPLIANVQIKRRGGFSLVELMVGIAILAILLSLAGPSFTRIIANHRVKAAAADIHMALLKARSEATSHNTDVTISPKSGEWSEGWEIKRGELAVDVHGMSKGVEISGPKSVTYRSSGRVSAMSEFDLTSEAVGTIRRCVKVDLSGRPYVKEGACS